MNISKKLIGLALGACGLPAALVAGIYFYSAPTQVQSGQSYYVGANFEPFYDGGGAVTLWKDNAWFADRSGWGILTVDGWTSDTGPRNVEFLAEGYDWVYGWSEFAYATVNVTGPANQMPVATIEVDGLGHGATVTRPYQGSVTVTVRYKATDGNGNLNGIRPQIWSPDGNLNNNGGAFVGQSGSSGEVVWSVTLNQNGNWYFWTDATDETIAPDYTNSGSWSDGFRLYVEEAAPPARSPEASVWANTSSLYTGQSALLYVRGTDPDGDCRYFNLDQLSPLLCFYGPGDIFVSSQQPNNGWWDLGSNSGDYTRTVTMSFDRPGTYLWRGAVRDVNGTGGWRYSPTNFTISVPNRDPSVAVDILDSNQNVVGLDGNGRARIYTNTTFYIRVNGSDPDGRLLRLYSRCNNVAGQGAAYEQADVSGGSASWTFGPYNVGGTVGVWDVWAHTQDADAGGYVWQGDGWSGSQSPDVEVVRRAQTIAFSNPGSQTYGQQITPSPSATSGLPVTLSVVSGPASVSFNTLTFTGTGTVVVRASQSGNSDYDAAVPVDQTFVVNKANQAITFNQPSAQVYLGSLALVASASSSLPVGFAITSGSASLSGNVVTFNAAGSVTVQVSQGGDSNYHAASPVSRVITVEKAEQTIAFTQPPAQTYGTSLVLSASATSGLAVSFSVVSGPANVAGNVVTFGAPGTVTLAAAQGGNANYNAAPGVNRSFSVNKATPTASFPDRRRGTQNPEKYTVQASDLDAVFAGPAGAAAPTGSITYARIDPSNGNVLGPIGSGVELALGFHTVRASYPGDGNYHAFSKNAVWEVSDDVDGDGIPGYVEVQIGTDPNAANPTTSSPSHPSNLNVDRPKS